MSKTLLSLVVFLASFSSFAQINCSDLGSAADAQQKIDDKVYLFNKVVTHFGGNDTITYDASKNYSFQGKQLSDWGYRIADYASKIMLSRNVTDELDIFCAIVPLNGETVKVYERVVNKKLDIEIFKHYQEISLRPVGKYVELNCNRDTLLSGAYVLKDTLIELVQTTFSPETYEEIKVLVEINEVYTRTGQWRYFDKKGNLLKTENYSGPQDWQSLAEESELCNLFDWENAPRHIYYKSSFGRLPTLIRIFNSIAALGHSTHQITYDVNRHGEDYYLDGHLVGGYQLEDDRDVHRSVGNAKQENAFYVTYESNEFDAYQPKGKQPSCNFDAYIPINEQEGKMYNFASDKKLEVYTHTKAVIDYSKYDCKGTLLAKGTYRPAKESDEMEQVLNLETYELSWELPKRVVCGNWKYYDPTTGEQIREEAFDDCN